MLCLLCSYTYRSPSPSLPRPGGAGAVWPRAGFVHRGALGHVRPAESFPRPAASASWWFGTKCSHQSPTYPQAVVAVPRAGTRWAHGVDVAVAPWLLLAVLSPAYGNGHGTEMGSACPASGQTLLPPDHSTNHAGCPAGRSAGSLTLWVWSRS